MSGVGAFLLYALVTCVTPGPNNVMLAASGANFGMRRSLPHILGVSLGFSAMVAIVGVALGVMLSAVEALALPLTLLGTLYLLYLAWRIATAAPPDEKDPAGRPFTFVEAAAFQWVNAKGWTMVIGAVSVYAGLASSYVAAVLLMAAGFLVIGTGTAALWAGIGTSLRRFLGSPGRLRAFNLLMAALLVASVLPTVFEVVPF